MDHAEADILRRRPDRGQPAPDFSLRNQYGETLELSALAGRPVVVMFYPLAFSRVCGGELAEIISRWGEFRSIGARLLAISCDSTHTLRAYAEELAGQESELAFDLLSDFWPHGEVSTAYGAFDAQNGFPCRETFVLDAELRVQGNISAARSEARDLDAVLSALGA